MKIDRAKTRFTVKADEHRAKNLFDRVRSVFRRGLIVAECRDGTYWIAVCGGRMNEAWQWTWLAAEMLKTAEGAETTPRIFELPERPTPMPDRSGPPRKAEVTRNEEGELKAPPGETFLFCGECGGTRFYTTLLERNNYPRRHVCCTCGNEIKNLIEGVDFPQAGRGV